MEIHWNRVYYSRPTIKLRTTIPAFRSRRWIAENTYLGRVVKIVLVGDDEISARIRSRTTTERDEKFLRYVDHYRWQYGIWRSFIKRGLTADEIMDELEIAEIVNALSLEDHD